MTGGRDFIALAASCFGDARPGSTALAGFLFGIFESASLRFQGPGLPPRIVQMPPDLVVVLSLSMAALRHMPMRPVASRGDKVRAISEVQTT